jgi:two-component system, cell cycle response regulator CtrA
MLILRVGRLAISGTNDAQLLRKSGISSEHCETGRDSLEFLRLYDYDLVLMDLDLPDMPGHEAIRLARAAGLSTPAIVLTESTAPVGRVKALDQGADDVVTVPCHSDELLARIRAVVRRSQGHANSVLRLGPVELSLDRHEVRVNGEKLPVSRREFGVLELLFLKQGVILNKNAFLNHLYTGMEEPEMKTIDVIICRLRKKLAVAGVPNLIDTVWGCGYILREPTVVMEPAAANSDSDLDMADDEMPRIMPFINPNQQAA